MKLNADCIRDVLLYLEKNLNVEPNAFIPCGWNSIYTALKEKYSSNDIMYSLIQLNDSGYIQTDYDHKPGKSSFILMSVFYITPSGHTFLAKIQDEQSWKAKISPVLSTIGSLSMSVIETIACGAAEGVAEVALNRLRNGS